MTPKKLLFAAVLGLGAVATVAGGMALVDFETAPGKPSQPPNHWPRTSKLSRAQDRPQLVVFAHPLCTCTAATLEEISQLTGAAITVLFVRPDPQSGWVETGSWTQAKAIQGATVLWDDLGHEAGLFGIATSGSVFLYGTDGRLLFNGGVTGSRGHAGPNLALARLQSAIQTGKPSGPGTPVFGCSLLNALLSRAVNE